MNPLPRYTANTLSALPAVNTQAVGSLAHASGLQIGSYKGPLKESMAASPGSRDPVSGLHALVIGRIISAVAAKRRRPSLTTPRNQLALTLASRIEDRIRTVLQVNRDGIVVKCSQQEARKRLRGIEPNVPEKKHPRFLKLLREARDHPISASNRSIWNHLLTEITLILDPIEQFTALEKVRSAKGPRFVKGTRRPEAKFRSELLNFFNKSLKNLLG
jgi:hypothetical protein